MSQEANGTDEGTGGESSASYAAAVEELERIVREIEDADISVDELSEKVERASVLIRYCRSKLHKTEEEVEEVLKQIRDERETGDHSPSNPNAEE
jgi:exodeoxyribonuclease VII small subunit